MTGLEILEGLSFVDPRYIAEAENARFQKGTSWMRWLSLAACLCILIVGAFAYAQVMRQSTKDALTEMSMAPAAAEPDTSAQMNDSAQAAGSEEGVPESAEAPVRALPSVASVVLRVTKLREGGFEAIVVEDTDLLEAGMQVRVVLEDGVYGADQTDLNMGTDALLLAENSTYDPETKTLYAVSLSPAEPGKE